MPLIRALGKKVAQLNRQALRRALTALAALTVVASPLVGFASPASALTCAIGSTGNFNGGTGTVSDPWQVATVAQLLLINTQYSNDTCLSQDRYFLQTADLDLSGFPDWNPIPTWGMGTTVYNFDGGNRKITGLTIISSHSVGNGLFSKLGGASKNIHVIAPRISGGGSAGAIAGTLEGNLTNLSVEGGSISGTSYVGGIAGSLPLGSSLSYSWSSARVEATSNTAGGLVSFAGGTISNSYSIGTVITPTRNGGLIGTAYNNYSYQRGYLTHSYSAASNGSVTAQMGGLAGEDGTLDFSGGISFWDTAVSGANGYKVSGSGVGSTPIPVGKTTTQMKDFATFGPSGGAWNITNGTGTFNAATAVWGICPSANSGYPFLLWQDTSGKACLTPDRPTAIAAVISDGAAAISWTAPSAVGASSVTSYTVTSYPGAKTCIATAPALTCTVTGLTNGQSYTFGVTATNASGTGWSGWSSGGNTPLARPTAVVGTPTAVAANTSATVSWTNSGAAGVTGYLVTSNPGGFTCTAAISPCTVTGLTNGTPYTFTVKTTNSAGAALTSSAASTAVTPRSVPGAPGIPTVSAADAQASLSWTAPVDNGGDLVTEYTVTSSPGLATCVATILGCTITGLTNGTAYTFTVKAKNSLGYGVASAASTSATPRTVPGAPTSVLATRGNAFATVSWTSPVSDGGSAITNYVVSASPGLGTCTAVAPAVTCSISGLTNGQAYTFTVVAHNAAGDSVSSSASAPVTPLTKPSAPTSVGAGYGNATAQVTWLPSFSDGGSAVVSYTATSSPEGKTCTATAPSVSCEITGLTNGTAYTFTVTARSGAYAIVGDSDPSAATFSVTPRTNPGAPTTVLVSAGSAHAVVTWTAPVNTGGATISEYQVRAYDSSDISRGVCTVNMPAALSCDVTGLTNGTPYTFAVFAYNSVGYGPRSTLSSAATPLSKPGAPTGVLVLANDEAALVTWTPPVDDGGAALTSYTVTSSPGGHTCSSTAPSTICYVPGLTNGQAYTFTVTARSAAFATVGDSNSSVASSPVTPLTVPGAPAFNSLTPGDGFLAASFDGPASDGGNAISRYEYSVDNGAHWTAFSSLLTSTPQNVTGLVTGRNYDVVVRAVNAAGAGASSAMLSATFVTSPAAPTAVTGVAGDAGVALAWTAPTMTGGRALVSYTATASPGGASCTVIAPITSCDISGLTNGTNYTFTVAATNTIGAGASSVSSVVLRPLSPQVTDTTFEIVIDVVVGDPVAGGSAEFSSTGLQPSSPWTLVVHSTPRLLSSGAAGSAGTILGNAVIPTGLEAGWHALTLSGRNYLGREASSTTWFEINAAGELINSSRIDPTVIESSAAAKLANTGASTRQIAGLACALLAAGFFLMRRRKAGAR